jgi:hypothetical protein
MHARKRGDLRRSIWLTLMDPWEAFGTIALLASVITVAFLIGHARQPAAHLSITGRTVDVEQQPSPQPSLDAVVPVASPSPSPSPSAQASNSTQAAPAARTSPTHRPAPTSRPPATASPTPTPTARPPVPVLVITPLSGIAPLKVTADASGSSGMDAPISTYSFNFGDGYQTGKQSDPTATHTYLKAGEFEVTLVVTDSAGRASVDVTYVIVAA